MLTTSPDSLPNDTDALKALLLQRDQELEQLRATVSTLQQALSIRSLEIEQLQLQINKLKRMQFGRKSEKLDRQIAQLETRLEDLIAEEGQEHYQSKALPTELPRIEHRHEPESCSCGACGQALVQIGEDITEQLDVDPARFFVQRHIRPQYACRHCETITAAAIPAAIIDGGLATPSLHAWVVIQKYLDHLPLYRIEQISTRHGVAISRSTLAE